MIATNNIFNIRVGKQPWFGQVGTKKGFVEFETREHAIRAWLVLMRTYRRRYQRYTIRDIVGRFAPPNENDTAAYVRYCAQQLCYSAHSPLKLSQDYCRLGVAMAWMETATKLTADDIWKVMKKYNIFIV